MNEQNMSLNRALGNTMMKFFSRINVMSAMTDSSVLFDKYEQNHDKGIPDYPYKGISDYPNKGVQDYPYKGVPDYPHRQYGLLKRTF